MRDIEQEIQNWLDLGLPNEEELIEHIKETARHFAEFGKEKAKEELLKDIVEGDIIGDIRNQEEEPYRLYAESDDLDLSKYKMGETVKMLIIKESDYVEQ